MIELMITIAIAGILASIAAPNFSEALKNNRLTTKSNNLVNTLALARQIAVSRGLTTTICHSNNADTATPSCSGTGSNWGTGYLIYAAQAGTRSNALDDYNSSNDDLIEQIDLDDNAVTIAISNSNDHISFSNIGLLRPSGTLNFRVCDDRTGENGKQLSLTATGNVNTAVYSCT